MMRLLARLFGHGSDKIGQPEPRMNQEVDRDYQQARDEAKKAVHQARKQITWFEAGLLPPPRPTHQHQRLEGDTSR